MPSPFPGMNPYLERDALWQDFHNTFIPVARELVSPQVVPRYFVLIDEHMYIREPDEEKPSLLGRGDVTVHGGLEHGVSRTAAQVIEAPAKVRQPAVDVERSLFLEIRDRQSRDLVTVLELLSPSNKRFGKDPDQYLTKRSELLESSAHFVEIDLLRGGPRLPWLDLPECDFYAVVSRVEQRPHAGIWPVKLRDPLPTIPIPLKAGDPDARLDLQHVLHRIYDAAGYGYYVYDSPPEPPLNGADAAWAAQLLAPA